MSTTENSTAPQIMSKRPADFLDTKISKSLSWILRHGAQKEGIPIRPDGYVCLSVLMKHNKFRNSKITDIERVVRENNKQRYGVYWD